MRSLNLSSIVALTLFSVIACSSDDSGGGSSSSCASAPLSCPTGKTCWVVTTDGKYDCIDAQATQVEGSPCQNSVGQAQCNTGMMCFPGAQGSANGTCQPFCAADKTCAGAGQCVGVTLINAPGAATVYACAPTGTGGTGGMAGSGGAAGSSSGGTAGSGGSTGGAAGSASGGAAGSGGASDAGAD